MSKKHHATCICQNDSQIQTILKTKIFTNQPENFVQCKACQKIYHSFCIGVNEQFIDNCPECVLQFQDPLKQALEVLAKPKILITNKKLIFSHYFEISPSVYSSLSNKIYGIEIRSVEVSTFLEHEGENTWPDNCRINVNDDYLVNVSPLPHNSNLKKRKDEPILIKRAERIWKLGLNKVQIDEEKNYPAFCRIQTRVLLIGVYFVKEMTSAQLISQIQLNNIQPEQTSKQLLINSIKNYCQSQSSASLILDKFFISIIDPLSGSKMILPGRGDYCKHLGCFCVQNFITLNQVSKPRYWKCPICQKYAGRMIIDGFLLHIIQNVKDQKCEKIAINAEGQYYFVDENQQIQWIDNEDIILFLTEKEVGEGMSMRLEYKKKREKIQGLREESMGLMKNYESIINNAFQEEENKISLKLNNYMKDSNEGKNKIEAIEEECQAPNPENKEIKESNVNENGQQTGEIDITNSGTNQTPEQDQELLNYDNNKEIEAQDMNLEILIEY